MVEQPDIVPLCHLQARVAVPADAPVLFQPGILDPPVLRRVSPADLLYGSVPFVASVRQAQFPLRIRLRLHALDHLPQVLLRRVVQRHQDTEQDIVPELLPSLPSRLSRRHVVAHLPHHPRVGRLLQLPPPLRRALRSLLQQGLRRPRGDVQLVVVLRPFMHAQHHLPRRPRQPPEERVRDRLEVARRLVIARRHAQQPRSQLCDLRVRGPVVVDPLPRHPVYVVLRDPVLRFQQRRQLRIPENLLEQCERVPPLRAQQRAAAQQYRLFAQDLRVRPRLRVLHRPFEHLPEQLVVHLPHCPADDVAVFEVQPPQVRPACRAQRSAPHELPVFQQRFLDHVYLVFLQHPHPDVVVVQLDQAQVVLPDFVHDLLADQGAVVGQVVARHQQLLQPVLPAPVLCLENLQRLRVVGRFAPVVDRLQQRQARPAFRVRFHIFNLFCQLLRIPQVVAVQRRDVCAPAFPVAHVVGVGNLPVLFVADQADALVLRVLLRDLRGLVRARVVHDDQFPLRVALRLYALDRLRDKDLVVVQRQHDADQRLRHFLFLRLRSLHSCSIAAS